MNVAGKVATCLLGFALPVSIPAPAWAQNNDNVMIVDSVKFFPAKGHEKEMLGATFEGSNVSPNERSLVTDQKFG